MAIPFHLLDRPPELHTLIYTAALIPSTPTMISPPPRAQQGLSALRQPPGRRRGAAGVISGQHVSIDGGPELAGGKELAGRDWSTELQVVDAAGVEVVSLEQGLGRRNGLVLDLVGHTM
jgi:hypothetical protein